MISPRGWEDSGWSFTRHGALQKGLRTARRIDRRRAGGLEIDLRGDSVKAPKAQAQMGETLIMLRNTYGSRSRWTNLGVQDVALRLRNSEPIPLLEGDWLSPWNIDTYMSKENLERLKSGG